MTMRNMYNVVPYDELMKNDAFEKKLFTFLFVNSDT